MINKAYHYKRRMPPTGFSLVELLIAMLISFTLIFACTSVYSSLQHSIATAQSLSNAQESLRTAHYLISRTVRQGYGMQLSGANPTREIIVTYGSEASQDNTFYGCLGSQQTSGASDTFFIQTTGTRKHLACTSSDQSGALIATEVIALDVQGLSAWLAPGSQKGVDINLQIEGMPGDMGSNGFTFSLAMRQRILIDVTESGASSSRL